MNAQELGNRPASEAPTDIVGHKTFRDGDSFRHEPLMRAEAECARLREAVPAWVDSLAEKWACCLAADHVHGPALKQCAKELLEAAYGQNGPPYSFVYGIGRKQDAALRGKESGDGK